MKKLLALAVTSLMAFAAHAGSVAVVTGTAKEKVNNRIEVNLYQVGVNYRFDNSVSLGTSLQKGRPKLSAVPDETRKELTAGYSTKTGNLLIYVTVARGWRERNGLADVDYYATTAGTRYAFNNKLYGDVSYRYRDTSDIAWQTETYFVGLGYHVTPKVAVQVQYGKTRGDFSSDQYGLFLINRF
jgi:opacity protein-like surface antigen